MKVADAVKALSPHPHTRDIFELLTKDIPAWEYTIQYAPPQTKPFVQRNPDCTGDAPVARDHEFSDCVRALGSSGWCWKERRQHYIGIDIDSLAKCAEIVAAFSNRISELAYQFVGPCLGLIALANEMRKLAQFLVNVELRNRTLEIKVSI